MTPRTRFADDLVKEHYEGPRRRASSSCLARAWTVAPSG